MRTVISHFFNEAYLLPWWLQHHVGLFDHGVMIDHGSTDGSADIVRQLAPHWRLVRSTLTHFDAYLTDFEVMGYEKELPGWKIALNTTEFLMPAQDLGQIEAQLDAAGRVGCACTGIICVDLEPGQLPDPAQPLVPQKPWGFDENTPFSNEQRLAMGLNPVLQRNRFFHRHSVGMYYPGRHQSFHPDSQFRVLDLMVFHYGYSPWNPQVLQRKAQIKAKLNPDDLKRGWGAQHTQSAAEIQQAYEAAARHAADLRQHRLAGIAIARCGR